MNEHEDNGGVTEARLGEEREGVGVVKKHITKSPIDGNRGGNR